MKKIFTYLIIFTLIIATILMINPKKELNAEIVDDLYVVENAEFRAAWISYYTGDIRFNNIEDYKTKINEILDILEFYNMNAMIFHVRANHEAWYNSKLNRPQTQLAGLNFDEFDPLEYVVTEAHKRGIEFHAWLNPYRIGSTFATKEDIAETFKTYPQNPASKVDNILMGSTLQILDPGIPENREFIIDTCMEIVENYDVDAIHFDDYFYAAGIDDSKTVKKYNTENLSVSNFRRKQVDTFIYDLKCSLDEFNQKNNRYVQLGISPTGVYRNASTQSEANTPLSEYQYNTNGDLIYPQGATIGCQEHYESYLYCDTLKWVNNEWINYILPQTYWARNHSRAPFEPLINWWNAAVKNKNVNLYSGMGIYMWTSQTQEAKEQLTITKNLDYVKGTSIYSFGEVMDGFNDENIAAGSQMSLVKYYHWNEKTIPTPISGFEDYELGMVKNFAQFENTISFNAIDNAKFYIVYRSENDITFNSNEIVDIIGGDDELFVWTDNEVGNYNYNVIPVSYTNTLGKPANLLSQNITGNVKYELYKDSNFQNKYDFKNALNVEFGNNVYIKLIDDEASKTLIDYSWSSSNESVAQIDTSLENIIIKSCGSVDIYGTLKSDETKIIKISLNIYTGDTVNNIYTVKFYDYDGTLLKEEQVKYGQSATPPTGLTRDPEIQCTYEFYGWSKDYTNITEDIELEALYSVKFRMFNVIFKNPDGTILKEESVPYGHFATAPENPTMNPTIEYSYVFIKWDQTFNNVTSDLVINAIYHSNENLYRLDFNTNGGSKINSKFYFYYEDAQSPDVPTKEGYAFAGWYFNEELTERCNFPLVLTKDTVLYAKWSTPVKVNFYNEDNEVFKVLEIAKGEVCYYKPTLTNEKYAFIGWKLENGEMFDFNTSIMEELNLYPVFDDEVKITYYDNNENIFDELIIKKGTILDDEIKFSLKGYTFKGWSTDKTNKYQFGNVIEENLELYPLLEKNIVEEEPNFFEKIFSCKKNCALLLIQITFITTLTIFILKKKSS